MIVYEGFSGGQRINPGTTKTKTKINGFTKISDLLLNIIFKENKYHFKTTSLGVQHKTQSGGPRLTKLGKSLAMYINIHKFKFNSIWFIQSQMGTIFVGL